MSSHLHMQLLPALFHNDRIFSLFSPAPHNSQYHCFQCLHLSCSTILHVLMAHITITPILYTQLLLSPLRHFSHSSFQDCFRWCTHSAYRTHTLSRTLIPVWKARASADNKKV
ncbi:hypothetical protein SCLCIDRAFT_425322 [Scleroderma citrinum Foug A]|uniref:Uncharacterized protein n=1 Tax=Scleroderma citrinum Foug A TaxID=1036808 RepID=A0A0C3EDF8_9AGAM|nr:hypothetical protein SCLCIDRAFT_425322 [Scleroderma citrinum Foug A]